MSYFLCWVKSSDVSPAFTIQNSRSLDVVTGFIQFIFLLRNHWQLSRRVYNYQSNTHTHSFRVCQALRCCLHGQHIRDLSILPHYNICQQGHTHTHTIQYFLGTLQKQGISNVDKQSGASQSIRFGLLPISLSSRVIYIYFLKENLFILPR